MQSSGTSSGIGRIANLMLRFYASSASREIASGVALGDRSDGFGRAGGHDTAPAPAAFGPQIDHPVGRLDHVQIVLDDRSGCRRSRSAAGTRASSLAMSSKCRPVVGSSQMKSVPALLAVRQVRRQLDALRFAAGKRGGRLPEPQVAQPDIVQHLQALHQAGRRVEEIHRLAHRELQHFVDVAGRCSGSPGCRSCSACPCTLRRSAPRRPGTASPP